MISNNISLPPSLESWSPSPLSAFNADADRGLDDYFRTITAASNLPHVESLQIWRVEADTPIAYYLLHLISSLFWPAHISRNNKHCLKSKCGVSWDASWVLRCGGQTCRRDVWQYLESTILGGGDDKLVCAIIYGTLSILRALWTEYH